MSDNLYAQDFFAWAIEQTGVLRAGRPSEADIGHIADKSRVWARPRSVS